MARLGRKVPVATGTRIPVRVETLDGALVALETTGVDGSWSVDVDPGQYRVIERWVETYEADAESAVQLDTTQWDRDPAQARTLPEAPTGSVAAARARRRGAPS